MVTEIYVELGRKEAREWREGSHLFGDGRPTDNFGKDMFDRHL